jgi:hypothetical protein
MKPSLEMSLDDLTNAMKNSEAEREASEPPEIYEVVYGLVPRGYSQSDRAPNLRDGSYGVIARTTRGESRIPFLVPSGV